MRLVHGVVAALAASLEAQQARAQVRPAAAPPVSAASDSVTIRIVNTELRTAVQLLGQYLDRPVLYAGPPGPAVTLETPRPVHRETVVRLLRGLVENNGFELVSDSAAGMYRVRTRVETRTPPVQVPSAPSLPVRTGGVVELFVIALKHARAADVAGVVNALYGKAAAPHLAESNRAPTLAEELRGLQASSNVTGIAGGTAPRPAQLSGEVVVVPDANTNSLLIRSNRGDYQLLETAVRQLDQRPLQVLIEVLIAEVQRDRSFSVGVDAGLARVPIRGSRTDIEGKLEGAGASTLGDFVLKVMGIGGVDLDATVRVAAGRGDVKILSRPVVIAANNQEARVVVGSQRPFVQVSRSLPTDAAVRDQIVQYKDVGTKLSVKPTISVDGSVQLDVTQEVSSATTETAFNAPVIATRSVATQLMINDGQTVVLGGLTDRQRDVASRGVPILSAIPFLGGIFGRHARRTTATELFVFLTPRVIRTQADADRLSEPLRVRAEEVKP